MTVREMSERFDVLYDNADQEAPGLNSYEKSLYLTMAANNVVDERVSRFTEKGSRGIRDDDAKRDSLRSLLRYHKTQNSFTPEEYSNGVLEQVSPISDWPNVVFVEMPQGIAHIEYDMVEIEDQSSKPPIYTRRALTPIRGEFAQRILRDPFRTPDRLTAYRIDHGDRFGKYYAEIIMNENDSFYKYKCHYYKRPRPIILEDLDVAYPGMGLSIEGCTKPYNSNEPSDTSIIPSNVSTDLSNDFHREIVESAVQIAILHYRENTLQNNVQIDQLNDQKSKQ